MKLGQTFTARQGFAAMSNPTKIKMKKYLLIKISKKLFLFLNGI